jgi:hypothetical protein
MGNLQITSFQKYKLYIGVGFLVVILTIATSSIILASQKIAVSEKDFPLEIDLTKTDYHVGEKIVFNATITNKSGRDFNVSSNGAQPCTFFHNINDNITHGEICPLVFQLLKSNEQISRNYEYEPTEPGTYILEVHYHFNINNVEFKNELANITVEVR